MSVDSSTARPTILYVSWAEDCSRSDSTAAHLGGESHMIYSPFWGSHYATVGFKYLSQSIKTLRLLWSRRPRVVFVMTPPVIAAIPVYLYCLITRASFVLDAHTAALAYPRWTRILFLHKFFSRRAATTIVTNEHWAEMVRSWGAHATIVSDVPVIFPESDDVACQHDFNIVFVSSFTPDEPTEMFLEAASQVPDVHFYVTGDYRAYDPALPERVPSNVTLTGFIPRAQYAGLLRACQAVICLTVLDHTMQRGAYEAIYLGVPVITSSSQFLREAFPLGTIHVENQPDDCVRGIRKMIADHQRLRIEAQELRDRKWQQWHVVAESLKARVL